MKSKTVRDNGGTNGWIGRQHIYGVVTRVED